MKMCEIAPGVQMPVLSIGTGGRESKDAYQIVANWLALGGRGIDTALNYRNQDAVKQAIEESKIKRHELFLTTKIPDCNVSRTHDYIQRDLQLLGVEYLDLVLIHGPRNGDCLETWNILESYFTSAKVRAIGVSNFKTSDLKLILEHGTIWPHVNQILFNLCSVDHETLKTCHEHGIVVEAYSPLGRDGSRGGDIAHNPTVLEIAKEHNVTTYQIALKWILQYQGYGSVLTFQSSSQAHQAVDAHVFDFELTQDQMERLNHCQCDSEADEREEGQ